MGIYCSANDFFTGSEKTMVITFAGKYNVEKLSDFVKIIFSLKLHELCE